MAPLAFLRRTLIGLFTTALGIAALVLVAHANEVSGSGSAHGLVIHDAASTLRDYCQLDADGVLWLVLPGGQRFELITSTTDPAIANPGDGAFHPFDAGVVAQAMAAVSFPLDALDADIFLLPFPRRGGLDSAAGPKLMLLSPGVRPLGLEQQHAEFVHELGHVVQYARMPDADTERWDAYRRLRGIADESVYNATAVHADRPHEIFAEDFRALFGDALANYSSSVENSAIVPPAQVGGLETFIGDLGDAAPAPLALAATPNPARGALRFTRGGTSAAALDVFDLSGRRVASIGATPFAGGTLWAWDGRDASGRRLGPGVLFARVRGEGGPAARVQLLP